MLIVLTSTILSGVIIHLYVTIQKGNRDKLKLEQKVRSEQQQQLNELKNSNSSQDDKIKQLENKLQSKLDEKARLAAAEAAKKTVAQQVVSKVTPTAEAATGEVTSAVTGDEYEAKMFIYMKESGNNPNAVNKSSGACGLGQALPCAKMGCALGDYACQDNWATNYMKSRYGTWSNAKSFWLNHRWW